VFKLFGEETGLNSTEVSINPTDSELSDLDLANLNVKGGGLTITKTTGVIGDEGNTNSPLCTSNTKSFQLTLTTDTLINDDAHSIGFLVNNNQVSSTSVIMATVASADNGGDIMAEGGIEVYAHTITDATSFEFSLVNRTGTAIGANSAIVINFVIL
jgi:hypothetical protein